MGKNKEMLSLDKFKTEDPTCISLYVPPRKPIAEVIAQLKQEVGIVSNAKEPVKSRAMDTLSRILWFLKNYKPSEKGFIIFCAPDYPLHLIEPEQPVQVNLYRSDTQFSLNYLNDVV